MSASNGETPPRATDAGGAAGPAQTGRIVAELGRPETAEETAARKAENTRKHRANQTTRNLILALLASLGIVLFIVLVVVRPIDGPPRDVNYKAIAVQAQVGLKTRLVAPDLPSGWRANNAELQDADQKSPTWYIGFLTPKQQFIGLEEGLTTTGAWFGTLLGKARPTGAISLGGIRWAVYNQRDSSDPGNFAYSLAATVGTTRFVLHGSASTAEFTKLALAVGTDLDDHPDPQGN